MIEKKLNFVKYAGFWLRLFAFLLDVSLVIPASVLCGFFDLEALDDAVAASYSTAFLTSRVFLISLIYHVVADSSKWQGTVGKKILKLKIVDESGKRISAEKAIGRYFASYLSSLLFFVGYLMIIFDDKKRSLHDVMSGTFVIRSAAK